MLNKIKRRIKENKSSQSKRKENQLERFTCIPYNTVLNKAARKTFTNNTLTYKKK